MNCTINNIYISTSGTNGDLFIFLSQKSENTFLFSEMVNFDGLNPFYSLGLINSKLISYYHFQTSPKAKKRFVS